MNMAAMWQFLAGLGLFLYGMRMLEGSLKELAGRAFKIFFKKHTGNKVVAIGSGTLATILLQSSSVVSLMVLALVGAGIVNMHNALAIIMGSNLGTTLSSWMVAILGFKFDIESFSFPVIALAAIGLMFFSSRKKLRNTSLFLIGFGLLFIGISYMKSSIEAFVTEFDLSAYYNYNRVVFVFIGFIATTLIQSSSAMMVIVLSALHQNAIPFHAAVAITIGSELGTSLKLILGSAGGIAAKKRVALGNVIFNLVTVVFATAFMYQLIALVNFIAGERHPLIALVLFQSTINFLGILLFLPFLNKLGRLLEKIFSGNNGRAVYFISKGAVASQVCMEVLEKEVEYFIYRIFQLNLKAFQVPPNRIPLPEKIQETFRKKFENIQSYKEQYAHIKLAEGEILSFYSELDKENYDKKNLARLEELISCVRRAMYSAKCVKDVHEDYTNFKKSSQDEKYRFHRQLQDYLVHLYTRMVPVMQTQDNAKCMADLQELMTQIKNDYSEHMSFTHKMAEVRSVEEKDIPTLMNVNRELYSSAKSLIFSLRDFKSVEDFEDTWV